MLLLSFVNFSKKNLSVSNSLDPDLKGPTECGSTRKELKIDSSCGLHRYIFHRREG